MSLSRSPLPRLAAALVLALASAACEDPTALHISLVPDPNLNSEADLVARIGSVRVVVDSEQGLYPASFTYKDEEKEVRDLDSDGYSELEAFVDLGDLGRLPVIRLERGGLDPLPLDLKLDGLAKDGTPKAAEAAGGVPGVRFTEEEVVQVRVPFNLRADFRPPKVTQVLPEDGSQLNSLVGSVVVIFSKEMRPLAAGVFQVLRLESGSETPVPAESITVEPIYQDGPSRAEYRFAGGPLNEGTYRVRVTQGALDASGRPLDQVPLEPGNQSFTSQFTVSAVAATAACAPNCEALMCGNGGTTCASGLDCVNGACVPKGCPKTCPELMVCDPAPDRGLCVDDCRVHGSYGGCDDGQRCDSKTGLCVD